MTHLKQLAKEQGKYQLYNYSYLKKKHNSINHDYVNAQIIFDDELHFIILLSRHVPPLPSQLSSTVVLSPYFS